MKVLWVTSRPLPAVSGGASTGEGWVDNLRRAFEATLPDTHLHIVSWGGGVHAPLTEGNATYYSTASPTPQTRGGQLFRRWRHGTLPSGRAERSAAVIAAVAPDIVHVHGSESFLGMVLERVSTPAVISLQGIASACEDYSLRSLPPSALLRDVASRQFLKGWGVVHDSARFRTRAATERRTMALCSDFIGRTEWDRAVVEALRPGARYHHVDEIMNPAFYARAWQEESLSNMSVLCVASGSPVKGVEVMLRALSILRDAYAVPVRLRIASHSDKGRAWRYWRRLIERLELRDAVSILGGLRPRDVANELVRASVFVHPSHIDNSPNALCEALLVGVPCVASFVGGVPSLVDDGRTGLLYPDRDPYLLAAKIRQVMHDRELAMRLGRAAREAARTRHDPPSIALGTYEVYEEIIARSASVAGRDVN